MLRILAGITSFVMLSGCGPSQSTSQSKAIVTAGEADRAFSLVYAIDYLPFNYIEDGCYARALYMAMELAAERIPSSAHYIYGDLRPNEATQWVYHVAPLLKVGEDEPWVLDPAFEQKALRQSHWIQKNFPQGRYTTEVKAGSAYFDEQGRTSVFDKERLVENFEEFPAFLASDILDACSVMYDYLLREGQDVSRKRSKLLSRTEALIDGLQQAGKLEVDKLFGRTMHRSCQETVEAAVAL